MVLERLVARLDDEQANTIFHARIADGDDLTLEGVVPFSAFVSAHVRAHLPAHAREMRALFAFPESA